MSLLTKVNNNQTRGTGTVKMNLLETISFKTSVSSVLNKDVNQCGKKFMFDPSEDTAWMSDQGCPQWIALQFEIPQKMSGFKFQFQGGFTGKDSKVRIDDRTGTTLYNEPFYPEDINAVQTFNLTNTIDNVFKIKFIFESSSDFFGRIIVYSLQIIN